MSYELGRAVREVWIKWALTQPNPKPSWLVPYDDLSEPDKEADRQIGEAIYALGSREADATLRYCEAQWSDERGAMIDKLQAANATIDSLLQSGAKMMMRAEYAEDELERLRGRE